jgi:hypothetical protein
MVETWLSTLHSIHDDGFSRDWRSHLDKLNQDLRLEGEAALQTSFPNLPPIWFNGDLDSLAPGDWTLVISLNHQLAGKQVEPKPDEFWDYCRTHNRDHWYSRFFRPLVRLSAAVFGEDISRLDEKEFATRRMIFVELIPYASKQFGLSDNQIAELILNDEGCKTEAEVVGLLIEGARPRLILVNGNAALAQFEISFAGKLRNWDWQTYDSPGRIKPKNLRHKQGWLETRHGRCPVIGFPFLRTMSSHNSYAEIDRLAAMAAAFFREPAKSASTDASALSPGSPISAPFACLARNGRIDTVENAAAFLKGAPIRVLNA